MKKKKIKKQIFKRTLALFGAMLCIMSTFAISVFAESPVSPELSVIDNSSSNSFSTEIPYGYIGDINSKLFYPLYFIKLENFNDISYKIPLLDINERYDFFLDIDGSTVQYSLFFLPADMTINYKVSTTDSTDFICDVKDNNIKNYKIFLTLDDNANVVPCIFADGEFYIFNKLVDNDKYPDYLTLNVMPKNYSVWEPVSESIIKTIVSAITDFVKGLGSAFLGAFTAVFLTAEGGLNNLGIFLLVFFGLALGYGVIRWITGLFRRQ